MNGRMSVKIDAALVGRAKRAALLRRKSLSGVVEDSLRAALDEPTRVGPSFADRWRGRFALVEVSRGKNGNFRKKVEKWKCFGRRQGPGKKETLERL